MKNFYNLFVYLCLLTISNCLIVTLAHCQAPQTIPYQAVARNTSGSIIANQNISIRFNLHDITAGGAVVYKEAQFATTNSLGLFNVNIGQGTPLTGTFAGINWGNGSKFVEVEIDPSGGSTYSNLGTIQLMSVPYALYANSAGNFLNGTTAGNTPYWNGSSWVNNSSNIYNNGGNVGIGTTTPNYKLEVSGDIAVNEVRVGRGGGNINSNTAIGNNALYSNTTGYDNTAIGAGALNSNETSHYNTAIGSEALYSNSNSYGCCNVAIGNQALRSNLSGHFNTAIGIQALFSTTAGEGNTAVGSSALYNSEGNSNTAIGNIALLSNTSGGLNVAVGLHSLSSNTTGNYNTSLGTFAGTANNTGSSCTYIGFGANQLLSSIFNNSTALGNQSIITASDQIRLGNSSILSIGGNVGWTTVSDGRFKKDIQENVKGLEFITKLRPVTYHLDIRKLNGFLYQNDTLKFDEKAIAEKEAELQTGFIAQEVEATANQIGYDFSGVDKPKNEHDHYGLRYAEFVVPLVKGMQEQQTQIEELKKQNAELLKRLETIEQLKK